MNPESTTQDAAGARASARRRQFRLSISSDMEDIWRRLKDVRPRAATRELEWLLRLGILAERAGGPAFATLMASIAAARPGADGPLMLGGGQHQAEPTLPRARFGGWNLGAILDGPWGALPGSMQPAAEDSEDSG